MHVRGASPPKDNFLIFLPLIYLPTIINGVVYFIVIIYVHKT